MCVGLLRHMGHHDEEAGLFGRVLRGYRRGVGWFVKARLLVADGSHRRLAPAAGQPRLRSQERFMEIAAQNNLARRLSDVPAPAVPLPAPREAEPRRRQRQKV